MASKRKKSPAAPAKTSAEYLQSVVERQMDMLKAYKTRQDDIVRELGEVQKALAGGSVPDAIAAIATLLGRNLKQAKDRQDNHAFALDIAIKALEKLNFLDGKDGVVDALSQIELLVPEAFEKRAPVGAAS